MRSCLTPYLTPYLVAEVCGGIKDQTGLAQVGEVQDFGQRRKWSTAGGTPAIQYGSQGSKDARDLERE